MPSIVKDPFKKNCVTGITVRFEANIFNSEKWDADGYVYFKNGNSNGQQNFKGDTFDSVVIQIKAFLETLD